MSILKSSKYIELSQKTKDILEAAIILQEEQKYITSMLNASSTHSDFWLRQNLKHWFVVVELNMHYVSTKVQLIDLLCYEKTNIAITKGWHPLTEDTKQMLNEERTFLQNGKLKTKKDYQRLWDKIVFYLNTLAETISFEAKLNIGDHRAGFFKKALEIRNNLTHPKSAKDLHVDINEFANSITGLQWLFSYLQSLAEGISKFQKRI